MAAFLIWMMLWGTLQAQDYGSFGETFPIQETNLLEYLRERLLKASSSEHELVSQKLMQLAKEPKALKLPNAKHDRSFLYDPTIVAKTEIKDGNGEVIIERGTKYNPLDLQRLPNQLLFFDATQAAQLAWAKRQEGIWILVKGQPLDLEQAEERPVYFDQFGYLSGKLGIRAIPVKVFQEGQFLRVAECAVEAK
jgi:conjugal transfer pilus assembly protein TraW